MLDSLFLHVLNMSFTGSIVILFVLALRLLFKKSPAIVTYALWSVVLFRLLCPFSFESFYSLLPINVTPIAMDIAYESVPTIDTGISPINQIINPVLPAATPEYSANPLQIGIAIGRTLWIFGILVLLVSSIRSYYHLQKQLRHATHEYDNIYSVKHLETPFVLGIIRPKIYLPDSLSEHERPYIILHEQTHIKRFDPLTRLLAFIALCVHWFNPLVWIAYHMSGRDMEIACDEAVLKHHGQTIKCDYSSSLLALTSGRGRMIHTPLAFGEGNIKQRIIHILNYQKPMLWKWIISILLIVILSLGLISNPLQSTTLVNASYQYTSDISEQIVIGNLQSSSTTMTLSSQDAIVLYEWLQSLKISKKELSKSRDENRDQTHTFHFVFTAYGDYGDQGNTADLFFHFSSDFDEVWIDNTVKPSFSYQVRYPTEVQEQVKSYIMKHQTNSLDSLEYAQALWNARTPYIGDNSAVSRLIQLLPHPHEVRYDSMILHTSKQPYTVEIIYQATPAQLKQFDTADSTLIHSFGKNAIMLLALIDNADQIQATLTDGTKSVSFHNGREWADYVVGGSLLDYVDGPDALQRLPQLILTSPTYQSTSTATFWVKPDEPLHVIGRTAAHVWFNHLQEESESSDNPIIDYSIHEIQIAAISHNDTTNIQDKPETITYSVEIQSDIIKRVPNQQDVQSKLTLVLHVHALGQGNYKIVPLSNNSETKTNP